MDQIQPSGHAGSGGLQRHSVGPAYPLTVIKVGDKWAILDCWTGGIKYPCESQYMDAKGIHRLLDMYATVSGLSVKAGHGRLRINAEGKRELCDGTPVSEFLFEALNK